jgi:hypothetical protein
MKEVLDYIDTKTDGVLNFIIDEQGINAVAPELLAKFLNDPVTMDYKQPLKVRVILKLLLGPRTMSYYIEDGSVIITTEAKAKTKLVVKTYPVGNLVGGDQLVKQALQELQFNQGKPGPLGQQLGQNIDGLTAQIMGTVEPESWKISKEVQPDAPGTIQFVAGTASLQIRNTLEVQYLLLGSGLLDNTPKK